MILDRINKENDIKNIPEEEWPYLAEEIREYILEHVSGKGGHLAPNLGVVELTMALHLFMDFPKDKLIFDVGHQCYTHKILTGRKNDFATLREYHGLSGFPKREESPCDAFDSGHSSNSISAGLGYAAARCLNKTDEKIVCLIGDGAMTGGVAYEALNNVSLVNGNFIICLNDNQMSISENVGGLSSQLSRLRTGKVYIKLKDSVTDSLEKIPGVGDALVRAIRRTKNGLKQLMVPGMFFEEMGITYLGPVDGHNIKEILKVLRYAARIDGPVLVHVVTKKGKGYEYAEKRPDKFHGTGPFELATGMTKKGNPSYTDAFSKAMIKLGDKYDNLIAITAAMSDGTGLKKYKIAYPERFFDVGIAEGHAVSFAAGLALAGKIPVFAVYSSFLQRGFDEIVQDVCMQKLHVIFAIDRAGLVGNDGPTHHGAFDIAYMQGLPNMVLMAPKNAHELMEMMRFAVEYNGPVAIRYPRGEAYQELKEYKAPIELGKSEMIKEGQKVVLAAYGSMVKNVYEAARILQEEGIDVGVVNLRFAKPLDYEMLSEIAKVYDTVITIEDHAVYSGVGTMISDYYEKSENTDIKVIKIGIPDEFIEQGPTNVLYKDCGMDIDSIVTKVKEIY